MIDETGLRLPPQAVEAEQSVLGCLLLDNAAWDRIGDVIDEKDFYRSDHRLIYRHIEQLIAAGKPADVLTVADSLGEEIEQTGGREYLANLVINTVSAANVTRYAEIVKDRAQKRELIGICTSMLDRAYGFPSESATELAGQVSEKLFALANRTGMSGSRPFKSVLSEVVRNIDMLAEKGASGITGISTGFVDLDRKTAGFQPGDLIVIAGRPSMGKTAIAMNIVEHIAVELGKPVAVFSLEMSDAQLVQRMLGSVGRIDQHLLRTGRLEQNDWERLSETSGRLERAKIVIEETYDLAPATMRAKARRLARENPELGLIVVDYLQLMEADSERRVDQIAEISRGLKRIAKELNVPVVALSQLNRAVEQRPNKRPVMSDLRDSGAIEQDADVILFMYRDEVYNPDTPNPGVAEVDIAKQRNGPTGKIHLSYLAKFTRFENFVGDIQHYTPQRKSRAFEPRQRADIDG